MKFKSHFTRWAVVGVFLFATNHVFAQGYGRGYHNNGRGGFGGGGTATGWHHAGGFGPGNPGNLGLVVRQTDEVHQQVGTLLDQLRRLQGTSVVTSVPFQTLNDNYFERIGLNFGFSLRGGGNIVGLDPFGNPTPNGNIDFRQGSFGSAVPQFGGFDAATQATTGFSIGKGGNFFDFGIALAQGNTRSNVTQAPVVNGMDGFPASVSDTSVRPFVTSVIPVVGGMRSPVPNWPPVHNTTISPLQHTIQQYYQQQAMRKGATVKPRHDPVAAAAFRANAAMAPEDKIALKLAESRSSSAGHGDLSVAEIKRRKAALDGAKNAVEQQEVLATIAQAQRAEAAGKLGAARIYYQQAARQAKGELQQELLDKLESLKKK